MLKIAQKASPCVGSNETRSLPCALGAPSKLYALRMPPHAPRAAGIVAGVTTEIADVCLPLCRCACLRACRTQAAGLTESATQFIAFALGIIFGGIVMVSGLVQ
jgi:hypothetical protein